MRSYRTVSPLSCPEGKDGLSLWHFPSRRRARALPGTLPVWSPDVPLLDKRAAATRPPDSTPSIPSVIPSLVEWGHRRPPCAINLPGVGRRARDLPPSAPRLRPPSCHLERSERYCRPCRTLLHCASSLLPQRGRRAGDEGGQRATIRATTRLSLSTPPPIIDAPPAVARSDKEFSCETRVATPSPKQLPVVRPTRLQHSFTLQTHRQTPPDTRPGESVGENHNTTLN